MASARSTGPRLGGFHQNSQRANHRQLPLGRNTAGSPIIEYEPVRMELPGQSNRSRSPPPGAQVLIRASFGGSDFQPGRPLGNPGGTDSGTLWAASAIRRCLSHYFCQLHQN